MKSNTKNKTPAPLQLAMFTRAGNQIANDREQFSCLALDRASRGPMGPGMGPPGPAGFRNTPERLFFEEVFGIGKDMGFDFTFDSMLANRYPKWLQMCDGMRDFRLMALALAHTLATEHNRGRY